VAADPPSATDEPREGNFDPLAKSLTAAVAIVVAAAGVLGAATGGLASLLQNDPERISRALKLAAVAAVIAATITIWPTRRPSWSWWIRAVAFAISGLLLGVATYNVLSAQVEVRYTEPMPSISAEWTTVDSGGGLRVSAEADDMAKYDVLAIVVTGQNHGASSVPLYFGYTGPDSAGKTKQQATVALSELRPRVSVDEVTILAVVLNRWDVQGDKALVGCHGTVWRLARDGRLLSPRAIDDVDPDPKANGHIEGACLLLRTMPALRSSVSPG
jgi:hypothetical protein